MTVRKIGRRWMLMGAGGAAIAIPALPSLLGGRFVAKAQDSAPRRMVAIMSEHGGVWQPDFFPDEAQASTPFDHELHRGHRGELAFRDEGSDRVLSPTLRAASNVLTSSIASKMNVLRGLDVPYYYGHARHILGNYGNLSNNHNDNPPDQETADQVMAYSDAVYETTPRRRLVYLAQHALSVELANRSAGAAGGFQAAEEVDPLAIFRSVYVESTGETGRPPPIDAIQENFRRLESGAFGAGARLGGADRARLTQYMDRLSDIRSSLESPIGAYCGAVTEPPGLNQWMRYDPDTYRRFNDIIMAAFMCDSSRIAVLRTTHPWHDGMEADGGYHEVAHNAAGGGGGVTDMGLLQRLSGMLREGNQRFFREAILDLVGKMDDLSEGEGTMLDNSLVWWSPEAGASTHDGDSIPVVTFGGAAGRLQTGQYLDLRNRDAESSIAGEAKGQGRMPGACYFQWTTTYLDAFGIPRSAWQPADRKSFSGMRSQDSWHNPRYNISAMDESCDTPLPLLTS